MFKSTGIPIGARIGLLLVAAVLPLATLSGVYAWIAGETARAAEMRARYETARVVAGAVEGVVEGASRPIDLILTDSSATMDPGACRASLSRLLGLVDPITDAAIIKNGHRVCGIARVNERQLTDMTGTAPPIAPFSDATVTIGANGDPAIRLVRALYGSDGPVGVLHVDLAPIWQRMATSITGLGGSRVFILNEAGDVIADPNGRVETSAISAVVSAVDESKSATLPVLRVDARGIDFVAIAQVSDTNLRIAVTSNRSSVDRSAAATLALVVGLPVLFLVAAVSIAWFGVERLVNRWVRRLGRATRLYSDGNLSVRVGAMDKAPDEFRALGESFDGMASRMEARSIELERALDDKNHFVRELHHRVKNNFQMIASLLTLQRRDADRAAESAIREAHDRVQALAAAYRASYADSESGSVPMGVLLSDLIERLRESARISARSVTYECTGDPISLHLDRAIPFALLITELIVPLFEQIQSEDDCIQVETAWADPEHETIRSRITAMSHALGSERPLSHRLTRAYSAQLGATVTRTGRTIEIVLPRHV